MHKLTAGFLAGFLATAPMTAVMAFWQRRLPFRERYALPPHEITTNLLEKVGLKEQTNKPQHGIATWLSHFLYGGAAGALYAPLVEPLSAPPVVKGAAYGLLVWTGSYLGLLPALKLLPPATKHPARRNALMIGAHIVWGVSLGLLTKRFQDKNT